MQIKNIRNFVIISHIDHGKSTLADRFLELTGTIEKRKMHEQMLDSMDLERERGITIKMAPVRMRWEGYELNLIDTPGHVDFSYEVSRALAAVEGAILLVDATKGIQAQTLAHLRQAQEQDLVIIPVVNKIDSPAAKVEDVEQEIVKIMPGKKIFKISARQGTGVEELLSEVIRQIPAPGKGLESYGRALIFDSHYDPYKGVLAYVRVFDGKFRAGDKIRFLAQDRSAEALEVGIFKPELSRAEKIEEGSIGYMATGLKEPEVVRVGDTMVTVNDQSPVISYKPLPGYRDPQPVVFASVFVSDGDDFKLLKDAFARLKLSDSALTFEPVSADVLGRGFRCGFLGSLHLEIILERLRREFDISYVATTPSVDYEVVTRSGKTEHIYSASEFPNPEEIEEVREPWVRLIIFSPEKYIGGVMELTQSRRGIYKNTSYLGPERIELEYEIPLAEIIYDFYDKIKSVSSGFASVSWENIGYRPGDLTHLEVLVAGERVEPLEKILPRQKAYGEGRAITKRLKKLLPRQLFAVSIQAAVGGKVIARETMPALRKDVTGYLYGGDVTRKKKLLEKQKKGKKKLRARGKVQIPQKVYLEMLKGEE